ncbi:hypothetical protein Taro_052134 [Colocasia esculenta]|uniref:Peptidase S8/S53 domain-containing protein n=1 Tax=Colocasia esculenta TaxID=4460 RepID=A0A843XIR4_COLES|nr:hypothetical protein [Colocasia esculenta]
MQTLNSGAFANLHASPVSPQKPRRHRPFYLPHGQPPRLHVKHCPWHGYPCLHRSLQRLLTGGCFSSDILTALDKAVDDGVNVLSLSLGSGQSDYFWDGIVIGVVAMEKGIMVSRGKPSPSPPTPTGKEEVGGSPPEASHPRDHGRMATILGNGEGGDRAENEDRAVGRDEPRHCASSASASAAAALGVQRGFRVQVPVAVERPQVVPILIPCEPEEGGVQGFKWYGDKLKVDEDGDVADEFLDEVLPEEVPGTDNQCVLPTFKINYNTRPDAVKKQIVASDGNVRQGVEHRGRLQWV